MTNINYYNIQQSFMGFWRIQQIGICISLVTDMLLSQILFGSVLCIVEMHCLYFAFSIHMKQFRCRHTGLEDGSSQQVKDYQTETILWSFILQRSAQQCLEFSLFQSWKTVNLESNPLQDLSSTVWNPDEVSQAKW